MNHTTSPPQISRQIKLPLRKAIEIAYKNIRLRLGRSLLVTSGIILATAFLAAILTNASIVHALSDWANQPAHSPAEAVQHDQLRAMLSRQGVASTPADQAADRTQTRWLVSLAMLVAMVGILNAMLMSVAERFREIGTMKCLGALDRFIIELFLIESIFQGAAGAITGAVLGLLISIVTAWHSYGGMLSHNFPALPLAEECAVAVIVGITLTVGGALYPAWQASRMAPIEAIRSEA